MQTSAIPMACSLMSPELVIFANTGEKTHAATNEMIIGGYLFSSNRITHNDINEIA